MLPLVGFAVAEAEECAEQCRDCSDGQDGGGRQGRQLACYLLYDGGGDWHGGLLGLCLEGGLCLEEGYPS